MKNAVVSCVPPSPLLAAPLWSCIFRPRSQESLGTAPPGKKASACWRNSPHSWGRVWLHEAESCSPLWGGTWWPPLNMCRRSCEDAAGTFGMDRSSSGRDPLCNTAAAKEQMEADCYGAWVKDSTCDFYFLLFPQIFFLLKCFLKCIHKPCWRWIHWLGAKMFVSSSIIH